LIDVLGVRLTAKRSGPVGELRLILSSYEGGANKRGVRGGRSSKGVMDAWGGERLGGLIFKCRGKMTSPRSLKTVLSDCPIKTRGVCRWDVGGG